ncbi:stage II sporulation protein D [Clostridium oryzae]|nr:stage II sporulation protein D [Clostridium oryzae]
MRNVNMVSMNTKLKYAIIIIVLIVILMPVAAIMTNITGYDSSDVKNLEKVQEYKLSDKDVKANGIDIRRDKIRVYLAKQKKVKKIKIEDYVVGVVSGEMPAGFSDEALKAQAVAARTYAIAHMKVDQNINNGIQGADVTDTTKNQVYIGKTQRLKLWPKADRYKLWNKIVHAVNATKGQVLTYRNNLVMNPQYFAMSSGRTESAKAVFGSNVPYLKSVKSSGESKLDNYKTVKLFTKSNLSTIIDTKYPKADVRESQISQDIHILKRSSAGGVLKIKLRKETIKGTDFRFMLGLRSTNFTITYAGNEVKIKCIGSGHGVGMSQWGANIMAKEGKNYEEILKHYYTGVEIKKLVNDD